VIEITDELKMRILEAVKLCVLFWRVGRTMNYLIL